MKQDFLIFSLLAVSVMARRESLKVQGEKREVPPTPELMY